MPSVTFTKEDLLERKQLAAGWRKLLVKEVSEKPGSSDPTSTTWPVKFVIDDGPDIGVPINHWFSEKAMGRLSEFVKCFTGNGQVEPGKAFELSQTQGRHVMGYCQYDLKTGFNTIQDFKPAGK